MSTRPSSTPATAEIFGRRMREARVRLGLPQDKLGVKIGIDEHTASARMSRYENGVHQAPLAIARKLAKILKVPLAYLYCDDDRLAEIILAAHALSHQDQEELLSAIRAKFTNLETVMVPASK